MDVTASESAQPARSKENTRRRLVDASIDVFTQKGVEGATVDDLTRATGFTRGAFYSNFSSKDEVFWEAFTEVTTRALAATQPFPNAEDQGSSAPESAGEPDLLESLESLRPLGLAWYLMHTEAVSLSLQNIDARTHLGRERDRLITGIAQIFEELSARYPITLTVPAETLAETLLGVYLNRMVAELATGERLEEDTSRILEAILDAFVEGRGTHAPAVPWKQ
ncbi:hypothetical protein DAD186_11170 [Dermabacter vaginalis]|uniref:HTH tetR-type domain-containing protein n=1 Tax=Dermabacter vaginalis TaxID=1630135 RepID=A0A1B0ZIC6_9MICO|nr:TetR/AcrR family transcriptional regulator [Dermabacter vaginalis]ANP27667.1 hypothetical protein DAD186_11170 [Dermabacter vaginalis]